MKKRNGFVSNSSSSSFCIMGVEMDSEELFPIYCKATGVDGSDNVMAGCDCDIDRDQLKSEGSKFCPKCGKDIFIIEEKYEDLETMCDALGIEMAYGDRTTYVGCNLDDNWSVESLVESLQDTEKKLKELFGDVDISVHSGVTYN